MALSFDIFLTVFFVRPHALLDELEYVLWDAIQNLFGEFTFLGLWLSLTGQRPFLRMRCTLLCGREEI